MAINIDQVQIRTVFLDGKNYKRFKKIYYRIKILMRKYTSNYAKNKDINEKYVSSDINYKDVKPNPVSSQNTAKYFTYKDYEDNNSFSMKQSEMPYELKGIKPVYNKR